MVIRKIVKNQRIQLSYNQIRKGIVSFTCIALIILSFVNCEKQTPTQKPNILLICIDDLRPELKSFGAEHISSPSIDNLVAEGVAFTGHYVNSPSCGPSRYTLLTGMYGPSDNYALFKRADMFSTEGTEQIKPTMPEWFRQYGYTTVSVGKVSHHPGGRGGADWNDSTIIEIPNAWDRHLMPVAEWEHPRGSMHGLANGEIREESNKMDVFQSIDGKDDIYPDGLITNEALKQLDELTEDEEKPFFLAVGLIKPHLPFGAPKSYMKHYENVQLPPIIYPQRPEGKTTWHQSGEFMKYNRWDKDPNQDEVFASDVRRHYAACVSYADAQVGKILDRLKQTGADKNTIVVVWGDHGWHLGEHAIWGKHSLFEESLRSPLVIYHPKMKQKGLKTDAIVETLDVFPTLCDLSGIQVPNFVQGKSLKNLLDRENIVDHPALAYSGSAKTIRTKTHRLILHDDGHIELYDHASSQKETKNIAESHPVIVKKLKQVLLKRLQ